MRPSSIDRVRAAVVTIFFFSGVSGLVYQVVWVRELSRIFGNTIHSAALVTGVFMGGLGTGSYVLGRWSDRRYRTDPAHPLRAYAHAELAIGALGLFFAVLLPRLTALSAAFSAYRVDARGFHALSPASHLVRYAVAIVTVAPATFLMGGTLTLLIRFLVGREVGAAGLRIGLLYGLNTAGAALGALLTDFLLVPRLGVLGAQLFAVALNLLAGTAVLALARRVPTDHAPVPDAPDAPLSASLNAAARRTVALTSAALLLSGFAAMGLEIVWFRYLSQILGELRGVFSLLLAVILVGIWLGSMAAGGLHRRLGRPVLLFVVGQALFALTTAALLGLCDHAGLAARASDAARETFLAASPAGRTLLELGFNLRSIALLVLVPAVFMGAAFPLANAAAQQAEASVARRAGALYLANTAGNVLGSALVGFALLPAVGIQTTTLILLAATAAAAVTLAACALPPRLSLRPSPATAIYALAFGALALAVGGFAMLPAGTLLRPSLPGTEGGAQTVLSVSEGLDETVAIADIPGYRTSLMTNGHSMSADSPVARRYMHAFAHLPLLSLERPERALVICFGTGNTLYAASLHPSMTRLDVADLSRHVLEQAPWFRATNHDVLADPRVSVFVNDGRHHLLMTPPGTYDLVTLEPPPIAFAGVSSLYSREFYALARSRLRPGGYLTQWLPGYQLGGDAVLSMVRAFLDVFPETVLLSGDADELILMGTTGPTLALDPLTLARRLRERPAVQADLDSLDLGTLTELAGTFAASRATLDAATAGVPALVDDRPSIEHVRLSRLGTLAADRMPASLFDVSHLDAFCPSCLATLPDLAPYLRVLGRVYAGDWFLSHHARGTAPPTDAAIQSTVAASPYLQSLYGGEATAARRVARALLDRGEADEAVHTLLYAVHEGGPDPVVLEELGRAALDAAEVPSAVEALARSLGQDDRRPSAHFAFAQALGLLGQRAQAIHEYRLGLGLDPEDADAHFKLGVMLSAAGEKPAGEAELDAALALDPLHPRANLVLCRRAAAEGRLAEARAHCEVASTLGVPIPPELTAKLASPAP